MPSQTVAPALKAWLAMHPLARQVFKHVHALARLLRRGRTETIPLELLE